MGYKLIYKLKDRDELGLMREHSVCLFFSSRDEFINATYSVFSEGSSSRRIKDFAYVSPDVFGYLVKKSEKYLTWSSLKREISQLEFNTYGGYGLINRDIGNTEEDVLVIGPVEEFNKKKEIIL